jgi:predicted transcriptional regulator
MRTISFRIEADKVDELDAIAKNLDRDRSYLLNQAVENYLREQLRFAAMVAEGIEDLEAGRSFTHDEVTQLVSTWEQAEQ